MSDQDKITKGAAFKAVNTLVLDFVQEGKPLCPKDIRAAIDALEPVALSPAQAQDKPDYEAMLKAIRLEIQGHIEAGISSPTWEEVLGKIKRIKEAFKHEPTKPEPDHKAMIEDLETDSNQTYAFLLKTGTVRLKDILAEVRARHTPQAKPEDTPEEKDEIRKPPTKAKVDCPPEKEKI